MGQVGTVEWFVCFALLKSNKVRNPGSCPGSVPKVKILKLFCPSPFGIRERRVNGPQQSGGSA